MQKVVYYNVLAGTRLSYVKIEIKIETPSANKPHASINDDGENFNPNF